MPGWRKINTDASFQASDGSGASGAVIRDVSGRVLAAMAKRYTNLADVLTAEIIAARDGLYNTLIFENLNFIKIC
jgi:hypothetical protein